WSESDPDPALGRDHHYGFINITSALSADRVFFNSRYHRESFLEGVDSFLSRMPDHNIPGGAARIGEKSYVLPLGLDLARFDAYRGDIERSGPPMILWNHRWEYDKNPEEFFRLLYILADEGHQFEVAVIGESFSRSPDVFGEAAGRLGERIVRFGYVEPFEEYARLLLKADIIPVTSHHDFFGASVVQAVYCDCYPVLPRKLAYPEHLPDDPGFFYGDFEGLVDLTRKRMTGIAATRAVETREHVAFYDWSKMSGVYDAALESLKG
ncbi:MAG TPA: DUF3524 domain-containing protein, partial [Candidatus Krumholzibacterium sp.]|nr:DUF3524 domain-containing protein [Candidatus Krumholzibacterium sp.]